MAGVAAVPARLHQVLTASSSGQEADTGTRSRWTNRVLAAPPHSCTGAPSLLLHEQAMTAPPHFPQGTYGKIAVTVTPRVGPVRVEDSDTSRVSGLASPRPSTADLGHAESRLSGYEPRDHREPRPASV